MRAILNKSWRQHPTKHQLYGHLPPITKTIQVRRTRHARHCWRSRGELISDVLLWTPTYGRAKAGRPARTYIQQLCEDTGCSPEDLPEVMNDRERGSGISVLDMMMMISNLKNCLNYAFVWVVLCLPLISNSSRPLPKPLRSISNVPTTMIFPLLSCSIAFLVLRLGLSTFLSFIFFDFHFELNGFKYSYLILITIWF